MNEKVKDVYDPKIYMTVSYDDLVTYALFSLIKKDKNPTFENLVEETFVLFPHRFYLIGHPEWPDSALINKAWLRCRSDKKYITGSNARGFSLTTFGLRIAESVQNKLPPSFEDKRIIRLKGDERTKAGKFVKHVEKSRAFQLFKQGKSDFIGKLDFYELIFCTPDSLPQTREQNFEEISQYLGLYNRDDLMALFEFCKKRFADDLTVEKHGGMIRRKRK